MVENILREEYLNDIPLERIRFYEEDIISINNPKKVFKIDKGWDNSVTEIIKDKWETDGRQTWVVKVIGKHQHFLHVLDKSGRSWVNIKGINETININDYIEIEIMIVDNGSRVKAIKLVILNSVD